jgi:putative phosphoesterase
MRSADSIRVGLVSDTHGLLRVEAVEFLHGSDFIVHAGDIGDQAVLEQLSAIAPVTAVRGNNDKGAWVEQMSETEVLKAGAVFIYVIHNLAELDIDPVAGGFQVVVSGHTHRPSRETRDGVLFVNPGSAGPRRFSLPVCLGELVVSGEQVEAALQELELVAPPNRAIQETRRKRRAPDG